MVQAVCFRTSRSRPIGRNVRAFLDALCGTALFVDVNSLFANVFIKTSPPNNKSLLDECEMGQKGERKARRVEDGVAAHSQSDGPSRSLSSLLGNSTSERKRVN